MTKNCNTNPDMYRAELEESSLSYLNLPKLFKDLISYIKCQSNSGISAENEKKYSEIINIIIKAITCGISIISFIILLIITIIIVFIVQINIKNKSIMNILSKDIFTMEKLDLIQHLLFNVMFIFSGFGIYILDIITNIIKETRKEKKNTFTNTIEISIKNFCCRFIFFFPVYFLGALAINILIICGTELNGVDIDMCEKIYGVVDSIFKFITKNLWFIIIALIVPILFDSLLIVLGVQGNKELIKYLNIFNMIKNFISSIFVISAIVAFIIFLYLKITNTFASILMDLNITGIIIYIIINLLFIILYFLFKFYNFDYILFLSSQKMIYKPVEVISDYLNYFLFDHIYDALNKLKGKNISKKEEEIKSKNTFTSKPINPIRIRDEKENKYKKLKTTRV